MTNLTYPEQLQEWRKELDAINARIQTKRTEAKDLEDQQNSIIAALLDTEPAAEEYEAMAAAWQTTTARLALINAMIAELNRRYDLIYAIQPHRPR